MVVSEELRSWSIDEAWTSSGVGGAVRARASVLLSAAWKGVGGTTTRLGASIEGESRGRERRVCGAVASVKYGMWPNEGKDDGEPARLLSGLPRLPSKTRAMVQE